MGPVRAEGDKGEVDGYFGKYDPTLVVNPVNFKKIDTPEGMRTTLSVGRTQTGFIWICKECGEELRTQLFKRPLHVCSKHLTNA